MESIVIRDKQTESIAFCRQGNLSITELITLLAPKPEEHIIIEDADHNVLRQDPICPPATIYYCRFVPKAAHKKRRNVVLLCPVVAEAHARPEINIWQDIIENIPLAHRIKDI